MTQATNVVMRFKFHVCLTSKCQSRSHLLRHTCTHCCYDDWKFQKWPTERYGVLSMSINESCVLCDFQFFYEVYIYILINVYECSWCEGNYFFRYESKYRKINKVYSRKFLYLKNRHKLVQSRQPISVVHYHPKIVWVSRTITTFSRMVPENPWTPPFPFHGGEFNTKSDLLPISTG